MISLLFDCEEVGNKKDALEIIPSENDSSKDFNSSFISDTKAVKVIEKENGGLLMLLI
jgi:hypothetical protein